MREMDTVTWAVISPPNHRSKRRYVDHSSLSYTRKGAIERHVGPYNILWAEQRKKGWTVERIALMGLDDYRRLHDRAALPNTTGEAE